MYKRQALRKIRKDGSIEDAVIFEPRKALQYNQINGGTTSDGMSSYYAKNPKYGANIKYFIPESDASIKSQRISREVFSGVNPTVVEELINAGYTTPKSIFDEEVRDIIDNTSLSRKEVYKARSIVKENQNKGVEIGFPGWKQLDAEMNESRTKSLVIIKNSSGKIVQEISGGYYRGMHEVNWDLTKDFVSTINSGSSYSSGFSRWVEPGDYSVELFKSKMGVLTKIAEPVTLSVERIKKGTLKNPESNNHEAYHKKLIELTKEISVYDNRFENSSQKVKSFASMTKYVVKGRQQAESDVNSLRDETNQIYAKLYGSKSKKEIGEKEPQSIFNRLSNARGGWYSSSYGPTQLHMQSFEIAKEMFNRVKPEMDAYFEKVEKVGKILEEAGAPIVLD